MAMDGNKMGSEIANAIMNTGAPPEVQAQVIELWQKIGAAIVTHIQKNAAVPAGIAVATSGSSSAQTGATTATGKVT
jgi:hypothetical protein